MEMIEFHPRPLATLKYRLRQEYTEVSSSHLSEALAAALGYRTHAALKKDLDGINPSNLTHCLLDDTAFVQRLVSLGYSDDPEFSFELLDLPEVMSTQPLSALDIEYTSHHSAARPCVI